MTNKEEMPAFIYSYLNATIGSSCEAFFAGYHPKNIPVAAHTRKDTASQRQKKTALRPRRK